MKLMNNKVIVGSILSSVYIGLTVYYTFFAGGEEPTMNLLWVDGINEFLSLFYHDVTGITLENYFGEWFGYFRVFLGIIEWFVIGFCLTWLVEKLIKGMKRNSSAPRRNPNPSN